MGVQEVHHNVFRGFCTINKKVCELIADNDSSKNFVTRKLVEYFKLPMEIRQGSKEVVVEICYVPISINLNRNEVACNVVDLSERHILFKVEGQSIPILNKTKFEGEENNCAEESKDVSIDKDNKYNEGQKGVKKKKNIWRIVEM